MPNEFTSIQLDAAFREDFDRLIALGIHEDLGQSGDLTTLATVPEHAQGSCAVVARQAGIAAGLVGSPTPD